MSEVIPSDSYFNYSPSNQERASVYIGDTMTEADREAATLIAQAFAKADVPVAETAVLIPVAAHQDGENVIPTLAEYANQRNAKPFTVFLHLNAPLDSADMDKVNEAEANVRIAQQLFPQLDIRHNTSLYSQATIGEIRKDLWNAAFLLAYHENGMSSDVIGINNDIDTHSISPHYISRIQEHYDRRRRRAARLNVKEAVLGASATRLTHAVLPTHPNTGKVTRWVDNTCFQSPEHVAYEAGYVIPFSSYATLCGFDDDSKTHETSWVSNGQRLPYISGAQLYTSPRRYVDRLNEYDTSAIWTNDSFGPDDQCREMLRDDITPERADEVILNRLHDDIVYHWLPGGIFPIYNDIAMKVMEGTDNGFYLDHMIKVSTTLVEKQLAKAERMLRKVVGSEILADLVSTSFDAASYSKTTVEGIHELYRALNDSTSEATLSLK